MLPPWKATLCSDVPRATSPESLAFSLGLTVSNPLPEMILGCGVSEGMNISGQSEKTRGARPGRRASTGNFPCACGAFRADQIPC